MTTINATFLSRTLASVVLVLAPMLASATALEDLRRFASDTKSATGTFTQQQLKNGQPGSQTSGQFAFSRPGKFRWVYEKPYEQTLVADGDKLWIYDKDLNQVTVRTLGSALGESPAAILFGSGDLDTRFTLSEAPARDGAVWVDAVPKTRDTTFERVSIAFRAGQLDAMELRDTFGQTSVLKFSGIARNAAVAPDQFKFIPPKGADVLQQ
ncbi:outer membrane lipoprotein chaperone LolA [soil metagenome]